VAVKIVRQLKKIALIGAPTSAAALAAGHEEAPAALRAAGLADRLRAIGYEVNDLGDCAKQVFQPDDEHPRARNVGAILKGLEDLRPRVEVAVKSGALPLILGGDCVIALGTIAGVRRYFRNVSLVYLDRDADLHVPATTSTGCINGMVISLVAGRGAAELVRFWGEPPLVREPDIVLFGVERLDPAEEQVLQREPIVSHPAAEVSRRGAANVARASIERVHAKSHEFVLHLDADVISGDDFRAVENAGSGGLRLDEVRESLEVFTAQKNLAAFEISMYNPGLDADGSQARILIELLASALGARLEALATAEASASAAAGAQTGVAPTQETESAPAAQAAPTARPASVAEAGSGAPEETAGMPPTVPPPQEASATDPTKPRVGSAEAADPQAPDIGGESD
jgi:arginase